MRFLGQILVCFILLSTRDHLLLAADLTLPLTEKHDLVGVDLSYYEQSEEQEQKRDRNSEDSQNPDRSSLDGPFWTVSLEDTIIDGIKKMSSIPEDSKPLVPKNPLNDRSYHVYMQNLDALLYIPADLKLGQCPGLGSLLVDTLGFIPVIPATGVIRATTRNLIGAAQGTTMGNIAITATVLFLTPSYIGQFAERRRLFTKDCCATQSSRSSFSWINRELKLTPQQHLMIPTSHARKVLKTLLFAGTVINSAARVVQMVQLYLGDVSSSDRSQALGWVGGTGPFYFGADVETNYTNGAREIDRFFNKSQAEKDIRGIKDLFVARTRHMKLAIASCTDETKIKTRYDIVTTQQAGPDSLRYWQSSYLIMKRLEELPHDDPNASWENYVRDTALFSQDSSYRAIADWTAKGFILFGTWGRYEILSNTLRLAFAWMGTDAQVASWMGSTIAGIAVFVKIPCESNMHHNRAREIFRCAAKDISPDNILTQNLTKVWAFGGAAFFGLSTYALGLDACSHYPTLGQVILIGSAVALDLSAYYGSMKRRLEKFFRPLITHIEQFVLVKN